MAALVKGHDIRTEAGGFRRLSFDGRNFSATRGEAIRIGHAGFDHPVNPRSNVLNTHQHI